MEPQQFLVAIVGPSGVGKSTVIREVVRAGQGTYVHVRAYTTRPSREEEIDRIHMPLEEFAEKARKKDSFAQYGLWTSLRTFKGAY